MIPHIALVDQTKSIDPHEMAKVSGAIGAQIQRDFVREWGIWATVGVWPSAPPNTWAVIIERQLDQPGALGYHTDDNNQPIAYVELTADWTVTVSHETLEMLADPFGNRMTRALLPYGAENAFADFGLQSPRAQVAYLVEACDPPEATSYDIGEVAVSDFLRWNWYRSADLPEPSYSHAGACQHPRQVADGGYVSFANPQTSEWYQIFNQGGRLSYQDLGRFDRHTHGSIREWTDFKAREWRASQQQPVQPGPTTQAPEQPAQQEQPPTQQQPQQ